MHTSGETMREEEWTTYSNDYTYLTEEGKEDGGDAEEGTARGSMTDGKTG